MKKGRGWLGIFLAAGCSLTGADLDPDRDGVLWPDDCDSSDPRNYPGADERCDGVDGDCDGVIDEGLPSSVWCVDIDGDGFGDGSLCETLCEAPDGYVSDGGDCDDSDAGVHPDAVDLQIDGTDEDCDGFDGRDADGDGCAACDEDCEDAAIYWDSGDALACWDCDDGHADVYQGAPEICGDGLVNDCEDDIEGALEACWAPGSFSDATSISTGPHGSSVGVVASAGDVDGDGHSDVFIGSDHSLDMDAVYLVHGPILEHTALSEEQRVLSGMADDTGVGSALDSTTIEGCPALIAGAPREKSSGEEVGAAYLVSWSAKGEACAIDGVTAKLWGASYGDEVGAAVAWVAPGDEGAADLLVAAPGEEPGGAVYLVHGPMSGDVVLADAAAGADTVIRLAGEATGRMTVAEVGDVDGDGLVDQLIGAPDAPTGGFGSGRAYLLYGGELASSSVLDEADVTFADGDASADVGAALASAGDLNGDGYADLLIGAPRDTTDEVEAGAVYLVLGAPCWMKKRRAPPLPELPPSLCGDFDLASADAKFLGAEAGEGAGTAIAAASDLHGDGWGDLLIGAPYAGDEEAGVVYLVWAEAGAGTIKLKDALEPKPTIHLDTEEDEVFGHRFQGSAESRVGSSLANAGDVDGDGADEILVGATEGPRTDGRASPRYGATAYLLGGY